MQSKKRNLEKSRRASLAVYMTVITLASLYAGLHLGVTYLQMPEPNLFGAIAELGAHITEHPFELFPADRRKLSYSTASQYYYLRGHNFFNFYQNHIPFK